MELLHSNLRKMVLCVFSFLLSFAFLLYQNSDEFCIVILIILLGHAVLRLHPVSTVAVCTFDGFSTEKSKSGHCTCGGRKPGTSFLMFYNLGLGDFPHGFAQSASCQAPSLQDCPLYRNHAFSSCQFKLLHLTKNQLKLSTTKWN